MWRLRLAFCGFALLILLPTSAAHESEPPIRYSNKRFEIYTHADCKKTATCSLKEVRFSVRDYHFLIGGEDNVGTSMHIWYRTDTFRALTDYVFVQFVRGCAFTSEVINGAEIIDFGYAQEVFSSYRAARYTEWIIDSLDTDPAYNFHPLCGRHCLYRFNTPPFSFAKQTEKYFGRKRPGTSVLYVSDHPSPAVYFGAGNTASNRSFTYRMGLYKAGDVSTNHPSAETPIRAEPLVEFAWSHSWIYNHSRHTFERFDDISPLC